MELASEHRAGCRIVADRGCDTPQHYCEQLELGYVLCFERPPFDIPEDDREFLLNVRQDDAGYHKNISYRRHDDRLRSSACKGSELETLRQVIRRYSDNVSEFVRSFLKPYAKGLKMDLASYRPIEERGRPASLTSRNDLLHVDAFPTRPTNGDRILRVFTNINRTQNRGWMTSDTFDILAPRFAVDAGLQRHSRSDDGLLGFGRRTLGTGLRRLGVPLKTRSPYDRFMLCFHDYLKANSRFQNDGPKYPLEFAPDATWLVFTDMVPHAVLFGQYALEQTYIVSRNSLLRPDKAPAAILAQLAGRSLTTGDKETLLSPRA